MAKLLLVFGTRPEAIKMFPVARALAVVPGLEVLTCVSGQHRGLLDQVLSVAGLRPDFDLNVMAEGQPLDALLTRVLLGVGEVLDRTRPDRVIVQGDTVTTLAATLAAHHRRVPVAHVEAGLRSGDLYRPWPEEGNRRFVTAAADLHFAPTTAAAAALAAENVRAGVHVTGNTGIDALHWARARLAAEPSLAAGLEGVRAQFAGRRLVLVTAHRRENLGAGMAAIAGAVARVADRPDAAVLFPVHPNPEVRHAVDAVLGGHPNVACVAPLDYPHLVRALDLSELVLTDSGGLQEEAPALGRPVLVMRDTTERPEGLAAGTARLVGADADRIAAEASRLLDDQAAYAAMARAHNPFGDGRAAPRIAALIAAAHGVST